MKVRAADVQAGLQGFWHGDRLQLLCSALVQSFLPLTVCCHLLGHHVHDQVMPLCQTAHEDPHICCSRVLSVNERGVISSAS